MNKKSFFQPDLSLLEFFFRLFLGGVFIYASFHKIMEPAVFAKNIYGYYLFPESSINLIAIVLPWVELFAGVCLCCGIRPKSSALMINIMLLGFILAISINLARGIEFDCGCFDSGGGENMPAHELLFRDIIYLAMGIFVMLFRKERRFCIPGWG